MNEKLRLIFIYIEFHQKPDIDKTPVWPFSNIRRMEWVKDTKFGMGVSNE